MINYNINIGLLRRN